MRRLMLEQESCYLEQLVSGLSLDKQILKRAR